MICEFEVIIRLRGVLTVGSDDPGVGVEGIMGRPSTADPLNVEFQSLVVSMISVLRRDWVRAWSIATHAIGTPGRNIGYQPVIMRLGAFIRTSYW